MSTALDTREKLIYWVIMQGLGVVVMGLWMSAMYLDIKDLKTEIRACNAENARLLMKTADGADHVLSDIRDLLKAQTAAATIQPTKQKR